MIMSGSMNWQGWLIAYFVVGAVVMALLWTFWASNLNSFARERTAVMEQRADQHKSLAQKLLERRLIPALALLFGWLVWPALLVARLWVALRQRNDPALWSLSGDLDLNADSGAMTKVSDDFFTSPHDRVILAKERIKRLNTDEIENGHLIDDPLGAVPALPFGHLNPVWRHLQTQLTSGRELWRFRSERVGRLKEFQAFEGYAVFDGGTYIDHMVTDFVWARSAESPT